jgi:membrane associated rhomboid family serine protease
MIPVRDSAGARRLAPANTILIVANLAVFAFEVRADARVGAMLARFAMVPVLITRAHSLFREMSILMTLITSQFLHAGILHLAGNLLYLFIFGPAVEARMGHVRFLGFYLTAGVVAGLALVAMEPTSRVAVVGASGAIAGVLGAYFFLFPGARIATFALVRMIEIPAIFYLLAWFALQLYSGIASGAEASSGGGVAWWAHVGGFLFGVAAGPMLAHKQITARRR